MFISNMSMPFYGLAIVNLYKFWNTHTQTHTHSVPLNLTLVKTEVQVSTTLSSSSLPSAQVELPWKVHFFLSDKIDASDFYRFIFSLTFFKIILLSVVLYTFELNVFYGFI